jgi:hypothetical protein
LIQLAEIASPSFGIEPNLPELPIAEYRRRLDDMLRRMVERTIDVLIVYADREHSANLEFLTGFEPRFEEALLLVAKSGDRLLLVGNECMGYLPDERLDIRVELLQELSLLGQPRSDSRTLRQIVREFGVGRGARVGCAGWKYFGRTLGEPSETAIDIPSYIVDLVRDLTGEPSLVSNATALFMDPDTGARIENSASQLAAFEYAAIRTSEGVRAALMHLTPGIEERELESCFHPAGLTLSCHPMVSFGDKAKRGLSTPSARVAKVGDTFTMAFGLKGALNARAGAVARGPDDLPGELRQFYPAFASNYFDVLSTWYEQVKVGACAGDVFAAVEAKRDSTLYRLAVNPGHYLHLDEWVHSPFASGSRTTLRSGAALQMDIIPVSAGPFCYINGEDGIALADEALRSEIAARFPAMWSRIQSRRAFMTDVLGIRLDPSVLPISNTPGWLPPYALEPGRILVKSTRSI